MKALVMTAQDAREFEKLGGLTITKPIKPEPPRIEGAKFNAYGPDGWTISGDERGPIYTPPVKAGDIVFLREPWVRLKNPATGEPSDRVILAADSTVSEGQTSYKWASPVSMPESAARRFAVVSKVEPIYNENVAVWSITLEAVTKGAAEAGEAGALPYSDAPSPEEGSPSKKFNEAGRFDIQGIIKGAEAEKANLAETYADAGRTALSAMEKSLPSRVEEPPASAAINRQTAAIVAAVRGRDGGGPGGIAIHVDKLEVRDDSDVERIARALNVGGSYGVGGSAGPFALYGNSAPTNTSAALGSRLQKLP